MKKFISIVFLISSVFLRIKFSLPHFDLILSLLKSTMRGKTISEESVRANNFNLGFAKLSITLKNSSKFAGKWTQLNPHLRTRGEEQMDPREHGPGAPLPC